MSVNLLAHSADILRRFLLKGVSLAIHSEGLPWFMARSSLEGLGLAGQENKVRFLLEIRFNRFQRRGAKHSLEIDSPIV